MIRFEWGEAVVMMVDKTGAGYKKKYFIDKTARMAVSLLNRDFTRCK
jgi:hypothetical protein